MKKIIGFAVLSFFLMASGVNAQKFGHINSQELLAALPAGDSAKVKLEKYSKELEDQLELMQVELNKKYDDYLANRDKLSALIKQDKETELQSMQQRIQLFQTNAEQELQEKKTSLFKPIYDQVNLAIAKVGKANGFIYVFDISTGALLYQSEQSMDIMPLVKKELGIQ